MTKRTRNNLAELEKADAELTDWVGKTVKRIVDMTGEEVGFWGDEVETFLFEFQDGSVYMVNTYGGNAIFGLPGAMYHGLDVKRILHPELII